MISLNGHKWSYKFGWIGQNKTLTRPEIKVFEAEAPLYDGVSAAPISPDSRYSTVYEINFSGFGCVGKLNDDFDSLKECKSLFLTLNAISGEIPLTFSALTNLEYVSLSSNAFSGSIQPKVLSNWSKIRELDLSFNKLSGAIPNVFNCNTKLAELNISGNKLTGELPDSLSCLVHLKTLKLYSNGLEGSLPAWLECMVHLTDLNMSRNKYVMHRLLRY